MFLTTRCILLVLASAYVCVAQLLPGGFRFVVHKGFEGFGDRLQQLLMVMKYASVTQRTLVLDWRGEYWSQDPSLGFDNLFELHGVKHFQVSDFLQLWAHLRGNVRVVPEAWTYRLEIPHSGEAYKPIFQVDTKTSSTIAEIASYQQLDFQEEVVVYAGTGSRTYTATFFDNLRFHTHITWYFEQEIRRIGLPGRYVAVHLRGGDKLWRCENFTTVEHQCAWAAPGSNEHCDGVHGSWADADAYLADSASKLEKVNMADMPVVLLSDSPCLIQRWREKGFVGEASYGLKVQDSERARILGTLWDFMLMVKATHLVHDGHSTMSRMAEFIAQHVPGNWLSMLGA